MKVTVDTRHDSLVEALATIRAAFGADQNSHSDAPRPGQAAGGNASATNGAGSGQRAAAGSGAKRSSSKRATTSASKPLAKTTSGRNVRRHVGPPKPTSNVAPPGQADAIRAWAQAQGMDVKQAGRLSAAVIQAYQERPHHG